MNRHTIAHNLREFYNHATRWFWQRRFRGWDDREVWSLDMTLAGYIAPRLERLREMNAGHVKYPGSLCVGYANGDTDLLMAGFPEDEDDLLVEHWQTILKTMIEGFSIINSKHFPQFSNYEWRKIDNALCLFHKYYFDLWD